jgi:hypothetical protein
MMDTTNPKDLMGAKKIDLSLFPDVAVLYGALAMNDGAHKYGPYNWRTKHVRATVYITAARRHLLAWAAGEEIAEDSGVHHLGHVLGCIAILLDAQVTGALIDDRYTSAAVTKLLADANAAVLARTQRTQQQVRDLIESVTEATESIENVEQLLAGDLAGELCALEDHLMQEGHPELGDFTGMTPDEAKGYSMGMGRAMNALNSLLVKHRIVLTATATVPSSERQSEWPVPSHLFFEGNPTDPDDIRFTAEQAFDHVVAEDAVAWAGGAGEGGPAAIAEAGLLYGKRKPVYVTELDTEMTEAVEWESIPRHPLSPPGFSPSGWNGMKAGDVCWDLDAKRLCRVDEFLPDGDAYAVYADGAFITVKSNRLEFVGQMEVETHGQDRAPESSK